jgi:hypothetical protein
VRLNMKLKILRVSIKAIFFFIDYLSLFIYKHFKMHFFVMSAILLPDGVANKSMSRDFNCAGMTSEPRIRCSDPCLCKKDADVCRVNK